MEQILIEKEALSRLLQERDDCFRENSSLRSQLEAIEKDNAAKTTLISTLEEENFNLKSQVAYLIRRLWGKSSERHIHPTLSYPGLFVDEANTDEEKQAWEEATKEIETFRKKTVAEKIKLKPVRRKTLPEHLPRKEEHIYPDKFEQESHERYDELPPEIKEVLEHEPGRFYVRKIIRHKYVLKTVPDDMTSPVITAPLPVLPLARSYAGATLLSELMVNKYVNHLPFYRQIQMFKREGLHLSASTITGWYRETADLLRPMYYRLQELVLSSGYIQVDETTIPVIIKDKRKAVKSYLWLFRSVDDASVFFHYNNGSRSREVITPLLKNYQGALQTDGYEVYALYENKEGVLHLGCWAHARRKFKEALASDKERAEYALSQIGLLYSVERMADTDHLTCEERMGLRHRLSRPVITVFEKWLLDEAAKTLPKSPIGKAIRYTCNNYPQLKRYLLDGKYQIDNNLIENSVRPVALGRKNYLFCGNHSAAEDAAVIYSLMGCCKASSVNFRDWLTFILNNIHSYDNDYNRDLAELLPCNRKQEEIRAVS